MKIKLITFVVFLFSILSFSQIKEFNYDSEIKKQFTIFFDNIKDKKIENAVDFIYPKYLDLITREHMINILNFSYNNPAFKIEIQHFKIDNIDKPELIHNEYFSIATYSFEMKFKVDLNSIPNAESIKQKVKDAMISKYGKENVATFDNNDSYMINAHMKTCAISNDGKEWKFLILDKKYKSELINILPQRILDKF